MVILTGLGIEPQTCTDSDVITTTPTGLSMRNQDFTFKVYKLTLPGKGVGTKRLGKEEIRNFLRWFP